MRAVIRTGGTGTALPPQADWLQAMIAGLPAIPPAFLLHVS